MLLSTQPADERKADKDMLKLHALSWAPGKYAGSQHSVVSLFMDPPLEFITSVWPIKSFFLLLLVPGIKIGLTAL